MAATIHDITIEQGETYQETLTFLDENSATGGVMDLTDYTAKMQIRSEMGDSVVVLTLTDDAGSGIVLGGVDGTYEITIDSETTASFDWEVAVYDLFVTSPDDISTKLIKGIIIINPSVTSL